MAVQRTRPVITLMLVAVNIAVFVAMLCNGVSAQAPDVDQLIDWGANYAPQTVDGSWWRLFTCTFVHIGIFHLVCNMWVLWNVGAIVERLHGRAGFLVVYVSSGLFGSLTSIWWNPLAVSAGASGAVFGSFGALMATTLAEKCSSQRSSRELPRGGIAFLAYNSALALLVAGIDIAGHAGGLAGGFFCGLALACLGSMDHRARTWLVATGSVLVLLLGVHSMPAAPPDLSFEMRQFEIVERQHLGRFNAAVLQLQTERITAASFADTVEEILAPWRQVRARLAALENVPASQQYLVSQLVAYMEARETAWQLLVEAIHEQNVLKKRLHREKWAEAEELARQLNRDRQSHGQSATASF